LLLVQIEQKQRPPANIEIRHRCGGRSSPRGSRWAGRCSRRRRHRGGRWEKGRERTVDADGQAGRTTNSTWSESRRESRARGAAAAKRVVKSIRRGKGKTTKSGARSPGPRKQVRDPKSQNRPLPKREGVLLVGKTELKVIERTLRSRVGSPAVRNGTKHGFLRQFHDSPISFLRKLHRTRQPRLRTVAQRRSRYYCRILRHFPRSGRFSAAGNARTERQSGKQ